MEAAPLEEHPPLAGTNRTHIPPFDDILNARSPRRGEELKGQAEGRHPDSGRLSQRVDQQEVEEWETHAGHTGRREWAANQK